MARKTYKTYDEIHGQRDRILSRLEAGLVAARSSGSPLFRPLRGSTPEQKALQENLKKRYDRTQRAYRNMEKRSVAQGRGSFLLGNDGSRVYTNGPVPSRYQELAGILAKGRGNRGFIEKIIKDDYGEKALDPSRIRAAVMRSRGMANG